MEEQKLMQEEFLAIQNEFSRKISCKDSFDKTKIHTVAGVDLAYWKAADGGEEAVCCIVVLDVHTHKVLEKKQYSGRIECPYMPGFLAFRELPLVLKAAEQLEHRPDLYVFDGNGYLHPRHMGIASHASFYLNAPTIGVAKTYFRVEKNADYEEPGPAAGNYTDILISGEVYGRAVRTHSGVKPVFLSVGNGISLDTATEFILGMVEKESHIPLPTRLADLETHIARREILGG